MELKLYQLFLLHYTQKGYLKPVDKLLNKQELYSILDNYQFNGEMAALPFLFPGDTEERELECYYGGDLVAVIDIEDVYEIDKEDVTKKIFGFTNIEHPGVKFIHDLGDKFIAGKIKYYNEDIINDMGIPFIKFNSDKQYVFQSRNPANNVHDSVLQKYAPNLVYSTPFETTNSNDYEFSKKIKVYKLMKERYGVDVFVTLLPRVFAGPREAMQNVLIFRNLGVHNFIMGRGKNCYKDYHDESEPIRVCKQIPGVNVIELENIKMNGKIIRQSDIKKNYVDAGIPIPEDLMPADVAEILYETR